VKCCVRVTGGNTIDRVRIERAVNGQPTELNPAELQITIGRLATQRHMGLDGISRHLNYSRSRVAEILAAQRIQAR
jgi:hypothetical protein